MNTCSTDRGIQASLSDLSRTSLVIVFAFPMIVLVSGYFFYPLAAERESRESLVFLFLIFICVLAAAFVYSAGLLYEMQVDKPMRRLPRIERHENSLVLRASFFPDVYGVRALKTVSVLLLLLAFLGIAGRTFLEERPAILFVVAISALVALIVVGLYLVKTLKQRRQRLTAPGDIILTQEGMTQRIDGHDHEVHWQDIVTFRPSGQRRSGEVILRLLAKTQPGSTGDETANREHGRLQKTTVTFVISPLSYSLESWWRLITYAQSPDWLESFPSQEHESCVREFFESASFEDRVWPE